MSEWPTEWTLTLHATMGTLRGTGLSVHQCPKCFALVVEDFMPEHQAWHETLTSTGTEARDG